MKLRVYRNIIKSETTDDLLGKYQIPVIFIDPPKQKVLTLKSKKDGTKTKHLVKIKTTYFEELLEPDLDKVQIIPTFADKTDITLFSFLDKIEKQLAYLENIHTLHKEDELVISLKCLNLYCKYIDISPSLETIVKVTNIISFLVENYAVLDGLTALNAWWTEYSVKCRGILQETDQLLNNKIILDNYHRLDLNTENGYILNNRVAFNEFMNSFSSQSMDIPPRIIKNYKLVTEDTSKLEKIILSNQQKFVSDYLNSNTPYRGLLLYHGLGSGKSGASIAITNGYIDKKVVILLPASLKINYLQEIEKFGDTCFKPNLNWVFLNLSVLNPVLKIVIYKKIFQSIVSNLSYLGPDKEFIYENFIHNKGSRDNKLVGHLLANIYRSLQNSLKIKLKHIGIPLELLEKIIVKRGGQLGIWVLDNTFKRGDIIINKKTDDTFKILKIDETNLYLKSETVMQMGGGRCAICKSIGTNKNSCPLNSDIPESKKNREKHPNAILQLEQVVDIAIEPSIPKPILVADTADDISTADATDIIDAAESENYEHYLIKKPMNDRDKTLICDQIKKHFKYKYTLCSYNAGAYTVINIFKNLIPKFRDLVDGKSNSEVTTTDIINIVLKINRGDIENPFSNKVVVVDEIHNLISLIMPNTDSVNFNGGIIFELLMRAENLNLVCLSGTPSINDVFEFSILYNILNGFIKKFNFTINKKDAIVGLDEVAINDFLKNFNLIDRFELNQNTMSITRVPRKFIKIFNEYGDYIGVRKDKVNDISDKEFKERFIGEFEKTFTSYSVVFDKFDFNVIFNSILDTSRTWDQRLVGDGLFIEEQINRFKSTYIDQDDDLLYPRNFKNKISGLTSFYNERKKDADGNDIFPEVEIADQNIEFSTYQFIKYCVAREDERKKEKQAKLGKFIKGSTTIKSSFKTTTRQLSIFAFPPDITRVTNKHKYDIDYLLLEIARFIETIASGEEILAYKTDIHKKITDKIIELKKLKRGFLDYMTEDIVKNSFPENKFTEELLIGDFSYSSDNLEFIQKLLSKLYGLIANKKDIIIAKIEANDSLNDIIGDIKEEFDEYFLTDSEQFNNEFILNSITNDDEYNILLQHQINRIVESDRGYLDLENVVQNTPYNLSWLSPKYIQLFRNLVETPGSVFIYSQFLNAEGIGIFTKILEKNGFKELNWSRVPNITEAPGEIKEWCSVVTNKQSVKGTFNDDPELEIGNLVRWTRVDSTLNKIISTTHRIIKIETDFIKITKNSDLDSMFSPDVLTSSDFIEIGSSDFTQINRCRYVLWTGKQTNVQERVDILKKFNHSNNRYGQDCLILLATSSGAEGISLKNVRQVHIVEPYWNDVRKNQVIGRARRVKSHIDLEKEDRNVKVFTYVCKFSLVQKTQITGVSDLIDSGIKLEEINLLIEDIQKISKTSETKQKDIDEEQVIYFFTQLLNKYVRDIGKTDKNISTDEYLTIIAKRKAKLLNSFLYLIKENSVDCSLNLEDNQISDPEGLGLLECHMPNIEEDDLTGNDGYLYKLDPLIKSVYSSESISQKKTKFIKDASIKYQIIDFTVNDKKMDLKDVRLKCIVFPEKGKRILNNSSLYNYYSHFSINFLQEGNKIKIGKYVNSNLQLNSNFLQYVKLFTIIDTCDNEVREEFVQFKEDFIGDQEKVTEFKTLVYEKYRAKLDEVEIEEKIETVEEGKWGCPLCDTVNKITDSECTNVDCDMEYEDL